MSAMDCETARDLLPLLRGAALDAPDRARLEAHLAACDDCRAEAELLALLRRHPMRVPAGLAARITAAAAVQCRSRRPAGRPLALAATIAGALLIGGGLLRELRDGTQPGVPEPASPAGLLQSFWPADDGLAAGIAPALDDLSVDELELLLAELES